MSFCDGGVGVPEIGVGVQNKGLVSVSDWTDRESLTKASRDSAYIAVADNNGEESRCRLVLLCF